MKQAFALLGFAVLFLLHQDVWLWNDPSLLFGLPIGLTYHALYCVAVALFLFLLCRFAWPVELEKEAE